MRRNRRPGDGFTLVEVLTAATITVMITLVAVSALKAISDTSRVVERAAQTTSEVRFAARMLARDLANLYRDPGQRSMLLVGASQEAESSSPASLRFYTIGRMKARADQPEGDVYEVEYVLGQPPSTEETGSNAGSGGGVLFRRWWPNPNRDKDPGGIMSVIAENINVFQIRFYDGKQWVDEWTEDMRTVPRLIEVTLAMVPQGREEPTVESFVVSFPRLASGTSGGSSGQGEPEQPQQSQPPQAEGTSPAQPSGEPGGNSGR